MPISYFKRNPNQLLLSNRNSQTQGSSQKSGFAACNTSRNPPFRTDDPKLNLKTSAIQPSNTFRATKRSNVWMLNKCEEAIPKPFNKCVLPPSTKYLPWKRTAYIKNLFISQKLKNKSLVQSKKSLLYLLRKHLIEKQRREMFYTRTGKGYSLLRSGVRSVSGSNMIWTRASQQVAQNANKETTRAVMAVEMEHKKLNCGNMTPGSDGPDDLSKSSKYFQGKIKFSLVKKPTTFLQNTAQSKDLSKFFGTSYQQPLASNESNKAVCSPPNSMKEIIYVRTGSIGNKLRLMSEQEKQAEQKKKMMVEAGKQTIKEVVIAREKFLNAKMTTKTAKALARERVRFHLHNARHRSTLGSSKQQLKKSQQQCQFFCRFGKCTKHETGSCKYLHNPEHVAVCTKFLFSKCTNPQCLLTHKIIPDRMPDCSYFLQGICVNENCPYRHVRVSSSAKICSDFLKGYCKLGNMCLKKHTYDCPSYMATGKCQEISKCHLHHPKAIINSKHIPEGTIWPKAKVKKPDETRKRAKTRYFQFDFEDDFKGTEMDVSSMKANNADFNIDFIPCDDDGDDNPDDNGDHGLVYGVENNKRNNENSNKDDCGCDDDDDYAADNSGMDVILIP